METYGVRVTGNLADIEDAFELALNGRIKDGCFIDGYSLKACHEGAYSFDLEGDLVQISPILAEMLRQEKILSYRFINKTAGPALNLYRVYAIYDNTSEEAPVFIMAGDREQAILFYHKSFGVYCEEPCEIIASIEQEGVKCRA